MGISKTGTWGIVAVIPKYLRLRYLDLHRATARERYELLLQRCPGIVEHLALQDLASFLCITPQMLSKIRKIISFGAQTWVRGRFSDPLGHVKK